MWLNVFVGDVSLRVLGEDERDEMKLDEMN